MKKHNKKAFTLVELLVVIAIIAILAVVSIVGYTAFTKKARDSVAQQELAQVVNMIIAEDFDNAGNTVDYDITGTGLVFTNNVTAQNKVSAEQIANFFFGETSDFATDLKDLKGKFTVTPEEDNKTIKSITYTLGEDEGEGSATYYFATKDYKAA